MQFKLLAATLAAAATLASAHHSGPSRIAGRGESGSHGGGAPTCDAAGVFCCNSVVAAKDASSSVTGFLGSLGMVVDNLANDLGFGCVSMMDGASW